MRALHNMDFDFDITTYTNPDLVRLENVYGSNLVSIIKKANKVNIVPSFSEVYQEYRGGEWVSFQYQYPSGSVPVLS